MKKLLSLILSISMFMALMPLSAFAERSDFLSVPYIKGDFSIDKPFIPENIPNVISDNSNYIEDNEVKDVEPSLLGETLEEAHNHDTWTQVSNGDELLTLFSEGGKAYLTSDIEIDSRIDVPDGMSVELCLNGHVIYGNSSLALMYVEAGASLTIFDCDSNNEHEGRYSSLPKGGVICNDVTFEQTGDDGFASVIANCGVLTLNGGSLVINETEVIPSENSEVYNFLVSLFNYGTCTVNDASLISASLDAISVAFEGTEGSVTEFNNVNAKASSLDGNSQCILNNSDMEINGGSVLAESTNSHAFAFVLFGAESDLSNLTVRATGGLQADAVYNEGAEITINNGDITAYCEGDSYTASALWNYYGTLNVEGGKYSAKTTGDSSIASCLETEEGSVTNVTGGAFTSESSNETAYAVAVNNSGDCTLFGGTYIADAAQSYGLWQENMMTIGGDIKVLKASYELVLLGGNTVTVSNPSEDLKLTVFLEKGTGDITTPGSKDYSSFFESYEKDKQIVNTGEEDKQVVRMICYEHDDIVFDKVIYKSFEGGELESGNYVLAEDIDLGESIKVSEGETVNLCLCGHVIMAQKDAVEVDGTLNIFDCSPEESHIGNLADFHEGGGILCDVNFHEDEEYEYAQLIKNNGTLTINGGNYIINAEGGDDPDLYWYEEAYGIYSLGKCTINDGYFAVNTGCALAATAAGVSSGEFTINGGEFLAQSDTGYSETVYMLSDSLFGEDEDSKNRIISVNINGGKFDSISKNGRAFGISLGAAPAEISDCEVNVEGGILATAIFASVSDVKINSGKYLARVKGEEAEAKSIVSDEGCVTVIGGEFAAIAEGSESCAYGLVSWYGDNTIEDGTFIVKARGKNAKACGIMNDNSDPYDDYGTYITIMGGTYDVSAKGKSACGIGFENLDGEATLIGGKFTVKGRNAKGILQDGQMTVGGKLKIKSSGTGLYLPQGKIVSVSEPAKGMRLKVTLETGTGDVTDKASRNYAAYFATDNPKYMVVNTGFWKWQTVKVISHEKKYNIKAFDIWGNKLFINSLYRWFF